MDLATSITNLIFVILVTLEPEFFEFWHATTGITGFGSKLGRAYMIAAYYPSTPVPTTRKRVCPSCGGRNEECPGFSGITE